MRFRKNVADLTNEERLKFVNAVLSMKNSKDRIYDNFIKFHQLALSPTPGISPSNTDYKTNAAHHSPSFLPWHRAMIFEFEKELQKASGDPEMSLPYWDWTISDSRANIFLDPKFMGTKINSGDQLSRITGPFKDWEVIEYNSKDNIFDKTGSFLERSLYWESGPFPTKTKIRDAQLIEKYDGIFKGLWNNSIDSFFRTYMEMNLHDYIHDWIGGAMSNTSTAPNDPAFFLHHCNVDRLWAQWQDKYPNSKYVPQSGETEGQNWKDELVGLPGWTPEKVWDYKSLGYEYKALATDPIYPFSSWEGENAVGITSLKEKYYFSFTYPKDHGAYIGTASYEPKWDWLDQRELDSKYGIRPAPFGSGVIVACVKEKGVSFFSYSPEKSLQTLSESQFTDIKVIQPIYLAEFNGKIFASIIGEDNGAYITSSIDGRTWTKPTRIYGSWQTSKSMVLTAFQDKLFLSWVGNPLGDILVGWSNDGDNWSTSDMVSPLGLWRTSNPLGLAAFKGKLFLSQVGAGLLGVDMHITSSADPTKKDTWSEPKRIFSSWSAGREMNLTNVNDEALYTTFTQRGIFFAGGMYYAFSFDGVNWPESPTQIFTDKSSFHGIGMAYSNKNLYVAAKIPSQQSLSFSPIKLNAEPVKRVFGTLLGWWETWKAILLTQQDSKRIFYSFIGKFDEVRVGVSEDGVNWPNPVEIPDWKTTLPISVCSHKDYVYVGTVGRDNIARLAWADSKLEWKKENMLTIFGAWNTYRMVNLISYKDILYVTFSGTERLVFGALENTGFSEKASLFGGFTLITSATLCVFEEMLIATAVDDANRVLYSTSIDAINWTNPAPIEGISTKHEVFLQEMNGEIRCTYLSLKNIPVCVRIESLQ